MSFFPGAMLARQEVVASLNPVNVSSDSGILIDGLDINTWAVTEWLPPQTPGIVGNNLSIFVPFWEYFALLPSEIKIWRRLLTAKPFRWHFAPIMTLIMRYLLVWFAFVDAVTQYNNHNTNGGCAVLSVLFIITNISISTCAVLAMAWRTNAVIRGVVQDRSRRALIQAILAILVTTNIVMLWVFLIAGQWDGSWSSVAVRGICVANKGQAPMNPVSVTGSLEFWYYVTSILFDAYCALTITLALRRLAIHSQGFSKLIHQLLFHSVGYLATILMLMLLGIIWLRVQNAFWAANFIQIIQGAIVVRILMAEQEQAQRPHDTDAYGSQSEMTRSYVTTGVASLAPDNASSIVDGRALDMESGPAIEMLRKRRSTSRTRRNSSGAERKGSNPSQWTDTCSTHSSDVRFAPVLHAPRMSASTLDDARYALPSRQLQSTSRGTGTTKAQPSLSLVPTPDDDAILPAPTDASPLSSPKSGTAPSYRMGHGSDRSFTGESSKWSGKDDLGQRPTRHDDPLINTHILNHGQSRSDQESPPTSTPVDNGLKTSHPIPQRPPRASGRSLARHIDVVRSGSWSIESPWDTQYDSSGTPIPDWSTSEYGQPPTDLSSLAVAPAPTQPPSDEASQEPYKVGTITAEPFRPDT